MTTVEDFENAPVGATATHKAAGYRAMKIDDIERRWITSNGFYVDDEVMGQRGYTRDPIAPTTAREALDLAWELAHDVKPGQVIPKGAQYLEEQGDGLKEFTALNDFEINPGYVSVIRTLEPLPEPEPEWLDAPAVLAVCNDRMDRKLWLDKHGVPIITTTRNGEKNAVRWGWTPATARPLPTRDEIAEVIEAEILDFFDCPGLHPDLPFAVADAVLALLKGQEE